MNWFAYETKGTTLFFTVVSSEELDLLPVSFKCFDFLYVSCLLWTIRARCAGLRSSYVLRGVYCVVLHFTRFGSSCVVILDFYGYETTDYCWFVGNSSLWDDWIGGPYICLIFVGLTWEARLSIQSSSIYESLSGLRRSDNFNLLTIIQMTKNY